MSLKKPGNLISYTKKIALIAVFSAMLTGAKFALSWIPNVEIVTLLIAVFAYSYGSRYAIPVATVFSITDILIYGFGYWVISYLIHWNVLAITVCILRYKGVKSEYIYALVVGIITFLFGLLTSFIDVSLSGGFSYFGERFIVYYSRGAVFYIIHIACNVILIITLFKPLSDIAEKMKERYFK